MSQAAIATDLVDLGTLRSGNAGTSSVSGVSADGSVIVVNAATDSGSTHAFIYHNAINALWSMLTILALFWVKMLLS